jgi:glycerol-3-phosphate dehydrogenase
MVAINHRILNTVVNRCKKPSDGDIIVPAHTVAVIGTTDVKVADPDHYAIEPWEVQLMLEEGDKLVPGMKDMRILRAWAGVRPLYQETSAASDRDLTRAFILLDHALRDRVEGLVTITSGKWTTYRKMAETTSDLVCVKLGVSRPCRTALEPLPAAHQGHHFLGSRLREVEDAAAYGNLVCECELVTFADVRQAIVDGNPQTIDDIRRDSRLGMGPCQGGFCSCRRNECFPA